MQQHGGELKREGDSHSIFINVARRVISAVPHYIETKAPTALKVCRDLEIPAPANVA